jgi:hypothetical protein
MVGYVDGRKLELFITNIPTISVYVGGWPFDAVT